MELFYNYFVILLPFLLTIISSTTAQPTNQSLYISCGLPRSTTTTSSDNRVWISDDGATFSPTNINTISSTAATGGQAPPYNIARLFHSTLTYTFSSLTPGPKFLRLYFTTSTSYNNIQPSQLFLSLEANELIIFQNFSPYLNSQNDTQSMYEFYLTIENHLNLTFSPGDGANNNTYGFINAIEIVGAPQGLYFNQTRPLNYLTNPGVGYTPLNNTALQTVYRLNVGGADVNPRNDSGTMWRTWINDYRYLAPGSFPGTEGSGVAPGSPAPELNYTRVPAYVAPWLVYASVRIMGDYAPEFTLRHNLTWEFEVDQGFDYLLRLHFCEMSLDITGSDQRVFDVFIDNQTAAIDVDVWALSGGRGVPIYRDYVIRVDSGGGGSGGSDGGTDTRNGTKVPLWLALHPKQRLTSDVLLNGLEIFKFSEFSGRSYYLSAPNPSSIALPPTSLNPSLNANTSNKHTLQIIGGVIGGVILAFLIVFASIFVYKRKAHNKEALKKKDFNTISKDNKLVTPPSLFNSESTATSNTTTSTLPSDLCRRFSLVEIKVATSDFDDDLVIGIGGFGKVYKGSIDNGTTLVAIKRLNPSSKQGAREFQTEIEMLSKLRHVHLVSLIGYCEDNGEMILVYEYMSRGTLRDHLMYKTFVTSDQDTNEPLSWNQRLKICLGSARGLHYLHTGTNQLIIHRDVKSTNILLDDKWTTKVADFGLSKVGPLFGEAGITHVSTAVKGSVGYLDPEYYRRQQLTEKSDVYSFGVVLFEVLCARPAMNPNLPKDQVNLAVWARSRYNNGMLHTIVDPNLKEQIAPESLKKYGEIAEMCVRDHGSERPSMGDVVWGLEFAIQLQETSEKNNYVDSKGTTLAGLSESTSVGRKVANNEENISEDDVFTFSEDNLSAKRLVESRTSMSSSSDYPFKMKSNSVFSEIKDPQAR